MKEHLLPRIFSRLKINNADRHLTESAKDSVLIKDNRVFNHKLARFYYTTYDVRRSEDIINPRTSHCNIMALADSGSNKASSSNMAKEHPFLYARVIGIYHVNIIYVGPGMTGYEPMRFDFLHVRWFQLDRTRAQPRVSSSWESLRLDRLSFPPTTDDNAFGFVDPSVVLRSCHLIPAFSLGRTGQDKMGHVLIPRNNDDWNAYYVNRCDALPKHFRIHI